MVLLRHIFHALRRDQRLVKGDLLAVLILKREREHRRTLLGLDNGACGHHQAVLGRLGRDMVVHHHAALDRPAPEGVDPHRHTESGHTILHHIRRRLERDRFDLAGQLNLGAVARMHRTLHQLAGLDRADICRGDIGIYDNIIQIRDHDQRLQPGDRLVRLRIECDHNAVDRRLDRRVLNQRRQLGDAALLFRHLALRGGNAAARCRNRILRIADLILDLIARQADDGRAAGIALVIDAVYRFDLSADRRGHRLLAVVCQCACVRRVDCACTAGRNRRRGRHALCERAGRIIHRDHHAEYRQTIRRDALSRIDRGHRARHLAHCGGDGHRGALARLDGAAVCSAELQRQLHHAVIDHISDDLALPQLLADVQAAALRRDHLAGKRRCDILPVQTRLCSRQRALGAGQRALRRGLRALRTGKLALCIRQLFARFGRVDEDQVIPRLHLVAGFDQHIGHRAADIQPELLAHTRRRHAATLKKGLDRAVAGDRGIRLLRAHSRLISQHAGRNARRQHHGAHAHADRNTRLAAELFLFLGLLFLWCFLRIRLFLLGRLFFRKQAFARADDMCAAFFHRRLALRLGLLDLLSLLLFKHG